jgi:ABC-type nitrate/sulfonate/bicarbonate transport system substrate-binding protein
MLTRLSLVRLLASTLLLGFASGPIAQERISFVSGLDPATAHGVIADALGLFKKHGIEVTVKKFSSAGAGVRTIYAGETDAGVGGDMNIVSPLAQGNKTVRIIGQLRRGLNGYGAAVAADYIKKPSDLKGRKVGLLQGSPVSHMFFELYRDYHKVDGVERVWLRPQEQLIAFAKGDIDALFIFSPWWQKALEVRPGAHVLAKDSDNNILNSSIVVVVHERLMERPAVVEAMLRAIKEADDYLNTNRKGTIEILRKEINLSPELIASILDSLDQRLTLDTVLVKNLCQGHEFLKLQGKISDKGKALEWDSVVQDQYLRKVAPDRVSLNKPIRCAQ